MCRERDRPADARRDPRATGSVHHRRHRTDASRLAVGTPVVAIFGPSDPARYATRGASRSRGSRRPALQPVQPHPAAAGPLCRPHAGLPDGCLARPSSKPGAVDDSARRRPWRSAASSAHDRRGPRAGLRRRPSRGALGELSRRGRRGTGAGRSHRLDQEPAPPRVDGVPLRRRFTFAATRCGGLPNCTCTSNRYPALFQTSGHSKRSSTRERPRSVRRHQRQSPGARRGAASSGVPLCRLHGPHGIWPFISSASRRHGRRGAALNAAALASRLRGAAAPVRDRPEGPGFRPPRVLARRHRRRKRRSLHRTGACSAGSASRRRQGGVRQRRPSVELPRPPLVARFPRSALPESVTAD